MTDQNMNQTDISGACERKIDIADILIIAAVVAVV
jgi:hypothetical protein